MGKVRYIGEDVRRTVELIEATLECAKTTTSLVAAVLVGKSGGKKIVLLESENGDSAGIDLIAGFVKEARPHLKPQQQLLTVLFRGISVKDLEASASHVKVID